MTTTPATTEAATTSPSCVHWWIVDPPTSGEFIKGRCKRCGVRNSWDAVCPASTGWRMSRKGQEKRREENAGTAKARTTASPRRV